MLLSSTTQKTNYHLKRYEQEQDGLMAWMGYIQAYGSEGSTDLRLGQLEELTKRQYNPDQGWKCHSVH